jgi:hypothetical protein
MQTWQIVMLAAAAVVVGVGIWIFFQQRRTRHLRDHFGPEYARTISETGDRKKAELELSRREQRIRDLRVRALSVSDQRKFSLRWMECQELFVDDPGRAVDEADSLLSDIMQTRGYSADSLADRISDISAAYPDHTTAYREADEIVARHHRGEASTEDLRRAFIHYRALFDEILGGSHEELKRAS